MENIHCIEEVVYYIYALINVIPPFLSLPKASKTLQNAKEIQGRLPNSGDSVA